MKTLPLILLGLVACSATTPDETATLGDLTFSAPDAWVRQDSKGPKQLIARWTPDANDRKETISIIRTELRPALQNADADTLERLLVEAQQTLHEPAVQQPKRLTTPRHLNAVEIESDFVPNGMTTSYHRVHAIVVSGTTLVHVLYTARTPDPDLKMFHRVLDSIHRGKV